MKKKKKKQSTLSKRVVLKGNITTKYQPANILNINTKKLEIVVRPFAYPDHSVLIHPRIIERQYH